MGLKLDLQSPEGCVWLRQLKAYIPRFVIAPDHLGFSGAAYHWFIA